MIRYARVVVLVAAGAGLVLAACLATPKPVVTPPTMVVHVQVQGPAGPVAGALVRLQAARPDTWLSATTPASGHLLFTVPASVGDSHLEVSAEGFLPIDQHVDLAPDRTVTVSLLPRPPPPPPFTPLPALRTRGQFFEVSTGARFTVISASEFNLLNRWQHEGEAAVEPVFAQLEAIGFNAIRVWTLYDLPEGPPPAPNIGVFLDLDYARLPAFLDLAARHHLYVELTGYTSIERVDHWPRLVAAVAGKTNALLELVNEADQPVNTIDLSRYMRPSGVLAAHGSNGSQAWPVQPPWSFETAHYNDAPEWWRKAGHNTMEVADAHGVPVIADENTRYCDRETSALHAYDAAAGAALLAAGICFHSVSGKRSVPWTDSCEVAAAIATVAGSRSVDLMCQDGPYVHRLDREGPGDLRVYERPVAGRACVVPIRK